MMFSIHNRRSMAHTLIPVLAGMNIVECLIVAPASRRPGLACQGALGLCSTFTREPVSQGDWQPGKKRERDTTRCLTNPISGGRFGCYIIMTFKIVGSHGFVIVAAGSFVYII